MASTNTPLDLYELFINQISGSAWLFIFISLAFIIWAIAYFKMPNQVMFPLVILYLLMMGAFLQSIVPFVLIVIALTLGWAFSRISSRG